jgi:hypothetical protein
VSTVPDQGWAGRHNGDLLRAMLGANFTVFVTMDRHLAYQQNVASAGVAIIVLRARTNRLGDLLALVPRLHEALGAAQPGTVVEVTG